MKPDWTAIKATLKGAWRSWTVWVAGIFAAMPEVIPLLQSEFATIAPFVPDWMESKALQVSALALVLLRVKTTSSLAAKAAKKEG